MPTQNSIEENSSIQENHNKRDKKKNWLLAAKEQLIWKTQGMYSVIEKNLLCVKSEQVIHDLYTDETRNLSSDPKDKIIYIYIYIYIYTHRCAIKFLTQPRREESWEC